MLLTAGENLARYKLGVRFVVLTSSRTGSTWLIDLLNMVGNVEAHGELFLNRPRLSPAIAGRSDVERFIEIYGVPRLTRPLRVYSYLNRLYRTPSAVGFKLMYGQLGQYPEIICYLAFRRVRVVHLTRSNYLDVIVSEELAKLTGVSHAKAGASMGLPMVRLDASTLVDRLRRVGSKARYVRMLMRLSMCPMLEVTYEALVDGQREFERVLGFLELPMPMTQIESDLSKRGARTHQEAIANFDEIRQVLISTPFSAMLR